MNKVIKTLIAIFIILFILCGLLLIPSIYNLSILNTFGYMTFLSMVSGISMIVFPCTLPLIFLIIPFALKKDYKKSLIMVTLFGLGISIMLAIYGIAMASLGKVLRIGIFSSWVIALSGLIAYIFGLSELSIFKIKIPVISVKMPKSIASKGDYIKSFFFGILLGNICVGCPNPLIYSIYIYIASTAKIIYGAFLGFINGIGRTLPILLITICALFGFEITEKIMHHRFSIKYFSGLILIGMGSFLIISNLFNLKYLWFLDISSNFVPILIAIILFIFPILLHHRKKF